MHATEIVRAEKTTLHARPVFVQGVMQQYLRELTAPLDVVIRGVVLRLPAGCVVSLTSGGSAGAGGSLMGDVDFRALDGRTYRATRGMSLLIPAGAPDITANPRA